MLAASGGADADRLARFQREAQLLATLNHSNIAQIYGLEKGAGTPALVLELVRKDDEHEKVSERGRGHDEEIGRHHLARVIG